MANPNMFTRIGLPLALAGSTLAIGACTDTQTTLSHNPESTTEASVVLNPEQASQIAKVCIDGFNMGTPLNDEFSLETLGSADSLMSSFQVKNEAGELAPVSPEIFGDKLLDEVCKKPEVLATITAFGTEAAGLFNGKVADKNTVTIARVQELAQLYRTNEQAAMEAIMKIASIVKAKDGAELVNNYGVFLNESRFIIPTRNGNNVTGLEAKKITVGDLFTGYLFNYNNDDTTLTEMQRVARNDVRMLVLIGKNGEFIVRTWIGREQVDFNVDPNATETTTLNTQQSTDNSAPTTGTTPSTGTTNGGNNGGGNGGSNGSNGGATSPDTTNGNGGGNNGAPSTTEGPATTTPRTTVPATTTPRTTVPATTTPPTTVAPTTTTKGAEPGPDCQNNPFDPRC